MLLGGSSAGRSGDAKFEPGIKGQRAKFNYSTGDVYDTILSPATSLSAPPLQRFDI